MQNSLTSFRRVAALRRTRNDLTPARSKSSRTGGYWVPALASLGGMTEENIVPRSYFGAIASRTRVTVSAGVL